jgi:DNA-binding winged helix-turn-helix (wHTH) protein
LTPRVYDTLLFLVEHAGELVEKRRLMQAVWPNLVVEDNNLDQHISTLRHVFGERAGENRYIVTVRGRG